MYHKKTKIFKDYWLSLLYKKLVGEQVFNVTLDQLDPTTRLYAATIPKLVYFLQQFSHSNKYFLEQMEP